MKHKTPNTTRPQSQSLKNILYVWSGIHQDLRNANMKVPENGPALNIFLTQNLGKAPPGRSRSPGIGRGHPPENKGDPPLGSPLSFGREGQGVSLVNTQTQTKKIEKQQINKYQKSNYYKHFNSIIMKKQILFLALFVLALFAGTLNSFGQVYPNYLTAADVASVDCAPVVTLNCVNDDGELTPIPGKTYKYGVAVTPGTFQSIHWFVTDDANVIAAATLTAAGNRDVIDGTYVLDATAATYDEPTNTTATIDISWKYFSGTTNDVILVAYVTGAAGCSDNIEVYRIEPSLGFTLDVAGLLDDGSLGDEECLSPIESATYDGTDLTTNYGENWVFFSVTAANFVHSWQPELSATVTGGSSIVTVQWAYASEAIKNAAGVSNGTWNATTVPVLEQSGTGAVGPGGECIVVRVQVDHGNNELDASVADAVVTLEVDGIMYDSENANYTNTLLADLDNGATPSDPCVNNVTDSADYTLTPRPSIVSDTTVGTGDKAFEPKN